MFKKFFQEEERSKNRRREEEQEGSDQSEEEKEERIVSFKVKGKGKKAKRAPVKERKERKEKKETERSLLDRLLALRQQKSREAQLKNKREVSMPMSKNKKVVAKKVPEKSKKKL